MSEQFIHKIIKRVNPYVMIDKAVIDDERLSFKAKGILFYLLSKPDNWIVMRQDIVNHGADGLDSVQRGMQELAEHGYAALVTCRTEDGRALGKRWIVAENPDLLSRPTDRLTDGPKTPRGVIGPVSNKEQKSNARRENNNESMPVETEKSEETAREEDKGNLPLFPELEPTHPAASVSKRVIEHTAEKKSEMEGEASAIYAAYPRKVGRGGAIREIKKALKKYPFKFLLGKVENYAICRAGKDPQYTWYPDKFFRDGHYEDDETEWTTSGTRKANAFPTSGQKPAPKIYMSGDERRAQLAAMGGAK